MCWAQLSGSSASFPVFTDKPAFSWWVGRGLGLVISWMNEKGLFFLTVKFQLINGEGMEEIDGHHWANITVIILMGRGYQWMLKSVDRAWWEAGCVHGLRVSPKIFIDCKRKNAIFRVEIVSIYSSLTKWSKLMLPIRHTDIIYSCYDTWRRTHHFCDILAKNAYSQFSHKKTSDKLELWDILQDDWSKLTRSWRTEESSKIRGFEGDVGKLSAMWDPALYLGTEKIIKGKTGEVQIRSII